MKHHVGYNETGGHTFEPLYKGHLSITDNLDQSLERQNVGCFNCQYSPVKHN